ncbi:triphosphoribosyl-dephospho-CoA synthase CitG [Enterococcus sp. DIV2402]|uniref:Probable 2-(5''-triphosphoribosyl)-3'-dephosphocoenzyme-A synthase n=1 Tax=Candidatus Enterococcus lowellii TaxID=2230877 RepID=A0ABZ2SNQ5_9ENTE|nr:triphosphoribosyl-dephospho-CoA synthase CitG [Enterococcus sp. DIV2402]MBO0463820.1 triphosphoribosyl-dephospho-CoA synthase CitG [Enterococcus sp. DIV2402]
MTEYLSQQIAGIAIKALLYEVSLSPKPGLVDRFSNGAHQDMDFFTFIDSIQSLAPFFNEYVLIGYRHNDVLPSLFSKLRTVGIQAEKSMLAATNQVNTHKGANFSFAVLLGATGFYLQNHQLPLTEKDSKNILMIVTEMTKDLIQKDFTDLHQKRVLSYGEKLYLEKKITGIRGEVSKGFPTLSTLLLPFLRRPTKESKNITLLRGLILLMSTVEDGNILHRGGFDAWRQVQKESQQLFEMELDADDFLKTLQDYDKKMTQKNLSPGGAADLLGLGLYFAFLENIF